MLFELTKCFALLSKKQDGTFLKMWCEEGTFRFHMSNNNNIRQSTFRQSTFNHHNMSTPDPRLSTLSTSDPKPNYRLKLRMKMRNSRGRTRRKKRTSKEKKSSRSASRQRKNKRSVSRYKKTVKMFYPLKVIQVWIMLIIMATRTRAPLSGVYSPTARWRRKWLIVQDFEIYTAVPSTKLTIRIV